jgi:hypothetical protein
VPELEATKRGWQKAYFCGIRMLGRIHARVHQTKLRDFAEEDQRESIHRSLEVHTVFSVDGSLYQRWQADLLAYSHRKVGQPGPLTRLLSADEPPTPFAGRTFHTRSYCPHPVTGDYYHCYNKVMALRAWLEQNPPEEEITLLLDPDCVFLKPLTGTVSRGHPCAQPVDFMDPVQYPELIEKHCRNPEVVDAVGVPILIHRDDLMTLIPLWAEKTEQIRNDPRSLELIGGGWLAEMWGYTLAAADIGLRHVESALQRRETEDLVDLPIVHYAGPVSDIANQWVWDKRIYTPWDAVPRPPDEVPLASKVLISLLNEWVETLERAQISPY